MRRVLLLALTLAALAVPSSAELQKYRQWTVTPEAYFLTEDEREEWSRLTSDSEAEAFIARYYERRGEDFKKELAHRIEMTDKYLSLGKKKGSETTRGKLAIVFGPPTKLERTADTTRASRSAAITPMVDAGGSDRAPGGVSLSDATSAATGVTAIGATTANIVIDVMTWSGQSLPKPLTEPVIVRVEIDSAGRERLQGSKADIEKLDALIDTVARASIRE